MPYVHRDICSNQLHNFRTENPEPKLLTLDNGSPCPSKLTSLNACGRILLSDGSLTEELCNFNREKIPSRPCFSKGFGAFGFFDCSSDATKTLTTAVPFSELHKETPISVRFSRMRSESGSPDTCRDLYGISVRFYSSCGNWDLVCSSLPVFYIRDPMQFPSLIKSGRLNPVTNVPDPDMYWDFLSMHPESTHVLCMLYSRRGLPRSYATMNGYSVNTYSLRNSDGVMTYCRFHLVCPTIECFEEEDVHATRVDDEHSMSRDMFQRISLKQYPFWDMYIQVITCEQLEGIEFDIFDCTKVWPHKMSPLCMVGRLTLNRLAADQFAEIEQMCFSPGNLIPGIEISPGDRMLQARAFAYSDSQRYRIGKNFCQIPCNMPLCQVASTTRAGACWHGANLAGAPSYYPNSFNGPTTALRFCDTEYVCPHNAVVGRTNNRGGGDNGEIKSVEMATALPK